MPDLNFVLPHWLYWSGLVVFPLTAMFLVRRQQRAGPRPPLSLAVGYLLLVTAGFVGIHRFYVRSWRGVLYIPLFIAIVLVNMGARDSREEVSRVQSDLLVAEFDLERAQDAADAGEEDAESRLIEARADLERAEAEVAAARRTFERWSSVALYFAIAIAIMLLVDAALLPRLVGLRNAREMAEAAAVTAEAPAPTVPSQAELRPVPREARGFTRRIEQLSRMTGEFVAYWSVMAVFAYYYEVIARYIFNSPTNWVHEGMFLMFGMQFLISGAYAYMTDSHVRVDVFYAHLSVRRKAFTDLLTSVFFFIFAGTLLVTGWIFMADSVEVWEVSFTEWAIQYWPVKVTIVLGAALILLQGIARLVSDLATVLAPAR
jgi:TRAP-type mannitol/chloroaromatic compound transport system permease small subunit